MHSNKKQSEAKRAAARYAARIAAGLCRRCGKHPPKPNRTRCASCSTHENAADRMRNRQTGRAKAYYHAHKDKYRDWFMRRTYGITLATYEELLRQQNGGCAVCHKKPQKRHLDIDHCHKSGKVRGLLCASCNTALGHLQENATFFKAALVYLGL